jgi:hypothetical protein
VEIIPQGKARDLAARLCDVNPRYITDAKWIRQHDPDAFARIITGSLTIPQAKRIVHRAHRTKAMNAKAKANGHAAAGWEVTTGDCLAEMEKLPTGRFRTIFADPPYNQGIDYGKGSKADRMNPGDYVKWCGRWMVECARLLTPDGSLWVLISDEFAGIFNLLLSDPWSQTLFNDCANLHHRAWIKWYETFGINCPNNFNRTSRHLFYCTKHPDNFVFHPEAVKRQSKRQSVYGDSRADPAGKIWDDVWGVEPLIPRLVDNAAERVPGFPTQIPLALVLPCVACSTDPGDEVLDPFSGSGTTGAACVQLGRRYLGIEKNPKFADLSRTRLRAATPPAERKPS